jgi:hypothetical protein
MQDVIRAVADRLRGAARVTVLTGAGVSAASGVPTFRGTGGLWRQFRATDLATPQAFARDPQLVWEWYALAPGADRGLRTERRARGARRMDRTARGHSDRDAERR